MDEWPFGSTDAGLPPAEGWRAEVSFLLCPSRLPLEADAPRRLQAATSQAVAAA